MHFLIELKAIGHQRVQRSPGEMRCQYLLLNGLHEELRNLRGTQLVPSKSGLTAGSN